jgi:phosphotransferase system  glucose/maltose/N-acetylglucosamine-specific IIC component
MSLTQIHTGLANASLLFSLLIAGFCFWAYFRRQGVDGNLWGILAMGELLYLVQGVVGLILFFTLPTRPEGWRWVHVLYGVVLVISLPGAFAYSRGKDDRRAALAYAIVGLFLAGVSLRAAGTAG